MGKKGKTAKTARAEYKKAVRSSKPGSEKRSKAIAKVLKAEGGGKKRGKKKTAGKKGKGKK